MKRLLCLCLALGCLFALSGCRTREERQEIRRQLDYATGKTTFTPEGDALEDGTTLEEQVFYDDHQITCTLLAIYEDEDYYYLPYSIRNDGNKSVDVSVHSVTFNGWNSNLGNSWITVTGGGMDYGVYEVYKDSLPEADLLRPIATIQLEGSLYGNGSYDLYENWSATLTTSNSIPEGQSLPGQVIYQDDLVTITFVDLVETSWEYEFRYAVENTSSGEISLDSYWSGDEDAPSQPMVNGQEIGDIFYFFNSYLAPGSKELINATVYFDDLEAVTNIRQASEITSCSFPCRVAPENLREYWVTLEADLTQEG